MAGINLGIFTKFHDQGINDAENKLGGLGKIAKNAGIAVAAGLAVATAATTALGIASVKAASNFEETSAAVGQVFGGAASQLENFAKTADKTMGQSRTQFLEAAKTFGIFGKAAGLSNTENANFSQTLSVLASDLASFNNTPVDTAITAIGAALRGESEPIRQFGVLLDDATLKARAAAMGIADGTKPLTQQQRVLAAYNEIMAQTVTQQGDFSRTAGGMANGMRIVQAMFDNLKIQIGQAFLPLMLQVIPVIQDFISKLVASPAFATFINELAITFGELLKVVVPLLDPIMQMIQTLLPALMDVIKLLAPIVTDLANAFKPVVELAGKIVDIIFPALARLAGEVFKAFSGNKGFADDMSGGLNSAAKAAEAFAGGINAIADSVKWVSDIYNGMPSELRFLLFTNPFSKEGLLGKLYGAAAGTGPRNVGGGVDMDGNPGTPFAKGGIVTGPTRALIGEAGPEAVIPLDRFDDVVGKRGGGINIVVNAGMGTDGAALGEQIVNAIRRYERTSGAVFARA